MTIQYKNRDVEIQEIDGIDINDYPDFCDVYVSKAYYIDTEENLDDDELDELTNESSYWLNEYVHEYCWEG